MEDDNNKVKSRVCPFSLLSLVVLALSIIAARADMGLAIFFLIIAGIIGFVSYRRIRHSDGRFSGKTPALIAIIIALFLIMVHVWIIIQYKFF